VVGAVPCLNGSVAYLPALFALIIIGVLMRERHHRAAPFVLWAAAIFAISITLRSVDLSVCDEFTYEGHKIGTHFVWQLLNAGVLFLLFLATFRAGEGPRQETEESEPEKAPSAVQQLALKQEAERLRKEEEEARKDAPKDKEPDKKEEAQKVTLRAFGSGHAAAPTEDEPSQEKEDDGEGDDDKEEEGEKENAKDKKDESSSKHEPSA
jgi:hypothetical protein